MEQSILENSKGATYMSFILDIEIVIKKDGARVNLAETKTKSQVSKKKEGESKEPYAASRNQDTKVYAVSEPQRRSIFELPLDDDQTSNLSGSNKNQNARTDQFEKTLTKSLGKKYSNTIKTTGNKENIPENKNFEGKTDVHSIVEKTSDQGTVASNNVRPKKKKITKAEKKAKVFKGKVEPIDFLECNRIFMCNYFKIPIFTNKRISNSSNRPSDSKISTSEENDSNSIGVEHTSFSTQKLDKQTFKPLKLHRFFKKNFSNSVNNNTTLDRYSSGDGDTVHTAYRDKNDLDIGKLSKTEISESKTMERKKILRRKFLIGEFKFNKSKTNSFSKSIDISDTEDNQKISTEHSCIHKEQYRKSRVLRKSKSFPKTNENMNFQFVTSVKSDINQHQYFQSFKKTGFSFMRALKRKTNSKTCSAKEGLGLVGLQINCFDNVDFVLSPQLNMENRSEQISNGSGDSIYVLKEEKLHNVGKHCDKFQKLGEISNETDNVYRTIQEKVCNGTYNEPNSSLVVEDSVSKSKINPSVLKYDEIEEKYDKITVKNTEQSPFANNEISTDLCPISKPDTCVIASTINIYSSASEENYLAQNIQTLGGNSCGDNLALKELKKIISNETVSKTIPVLPSQHNLNERPTQKCGADISQTVIGEQNTDNNEERERQSGKLKTPKLKTLHSYMKIVTSKFRK